MQTRDEVPPTLRGRRGQFRKRNLASSRQLQGNSARTQVVQGSEGSSTYLTQGLLDEEGEYYFDECACWCGKDQYDHRGNETEPMCICAKPQCCNRFMCGIVCAACLLVGAIFGFLIYLLWPRLPEYVFLHESPYAWHLNEYGEFHNTSAQVNLSIYNKFKIPITLNDINLRIRVNDSNGILTETAKSTWIRDQDLTPESRNNVTMLLWIPFAANTTVAPPINEALQNFTISFGLDGYVTGSLWGVKATAYTDCLVQVYFKNNGWIPYGPPESWTQSVNYANCTYSMTMGGIPAWS